MKIAYITQSYSPMISGAAIIVERLAVGMSERGHACLVLAASEKGNTYIEEHHNLHIVRLASITNPLRANQSFSLLSFHKIYKEINNFSPDIVHIHDLLSIGLSGLLIAKFLKIPVIATIHQLPWFVSVYLPDIPRLKTLVERSLWGFSRWLNKRCQYMIVPTTTISKTIANYGGFSTITISNGIDLNNFKPSPLSSKEHCCLCQKYNLNPNKPIILHVGRLDADKNVVTVIKAAAKTLNKINAQLLVVGDGTQKNHLIRLAHKLGIQDRCHFTGFVNPVGDLPNIYRLAAVFTTASEIETQGLVLLEAMASGLPIVAVRATCVHEVVKDTVNGYLVQPKNIKEIGRKLTFLIKNPGIAKEMGIMGRKISQTHKLAYSLNQHEDLYKRTLIHISKKQTSEYEKSGFNLHKHLQKIQNHTKIKDNPM